MTQRAECAHCEEGDHRHGGGDSMDSGRRVRCPACEELVCPSCRAMSGPTVCGSYADGDENADEIARTETPRDRRARLAAYGRAGSPVVAGDQYPLQPEARNR